MRGISSPYEAFFLGWSCYDMCIKTALMHHCISLSVGLLPAHVCRGVCCIRTCQTVPDEITCITKLPAFVIYKVKESKV